MINAVNTDLERSVEDSTGQRARDCYQCKRCSAGCPVAFAMDLLPHEVMKLVQYGQQSRVLRSSTIWLCASCETCSTRCPNEIDIAAVMDGLRRMSLAGDERPGEPETVLFHRSFLNGIKLAGRTNESVLIGQYKALSRKLFDDLGLGAVMFMKGKVKLMPRVVKDRKSVRRIFARTGGEGR